LQCEKNIVPDPCHPRRQSSSPRCGKAEDTNAKVPTLQNPVVRDLFTLQFLGQMLHFVRMDLASSARFWSSPLVKSWRYAGVHLSRGMRNFPFPVSSTGMFLRTIRIKAKGIYTEPWDSPSHQLKSQGDERSRYVEKTKVPFRKLINTSSEVRVGNHFGIFQNVSRSLHVEWGYITLQLMRFAGSLRDLLVGLIVGCGFIRMMCATDLKRFDEVYQVMRTNLVWISEDVLEEAAVKGLLTGLSKYVREVPKEAPKENNEQLQPQIYKGGICRIWLRRIGPETHNMMLYAFTNASSVTNITGLVVDLRFCEGDLYEPLGDIVGLFDGRPRPLLEVCGVVISNRPSPVRISVPTVILVNGFTRGAPEALAMIAKKLGWGIVIGSKTAGEMFEWKEYRLSDGRLIRVAVGVVRVLGEEVSQGITPDLEVRVDPEKERDLAENPIETLSTNSTIARLEEKSGDPTVRRINEAELERLHRSGVTSGSPPNSKSSTDTARKEAEEYMVIKDPVLARAIDLLTAVRILRR